jgi:hypothetical protein
LEQRRRCGFIAEEQRGAKRLVWARGRTATDECPKSAMTAASLELLESFFVWKRLGGVWREPTAREADAFMTLEEEWRTEAANGE